MHYGEIRGTADDLAAFASTAEPVHRAVPHRINLDPGKVERGLTQLVLSLVELVRRLVEKQALRRIEGGSLSSDQVEALGTTLSRLEQKMEELKVQFGIDDLNIDLGPLGNLFDDSDRRGDARWNDPSKS